MSALLHQKSSDDLVWFDHFVAVKPLGHVRQLSWCHLISKAVEAVFTSEEFADAAILGLKRKYPRISRKVDLKRHPSSGLYTLSFIDTDRLRLVF